MKIVLIVFSCGLVATGGFPVLRGNEGPQVMSHRKFLMGNNLGPGVKTGVEDQLNRYWLSVPKAHYSGPLWRVAPDPFQPGFQWSFEPPLQQPGPQWHPGPPPQQLGPQWRPGPPPQELGPQWRPGPPPQQPGPQWRPGPPPQQPGPQWRPGPPPQQRGPQWRPRPPFQQPRQEWHRVPAVQPWPSVHESFQHPEWNPSLFQFDVENLLNAWDPSVLPHQRPSADHTARSFVGNQNNVGPILGLEPLGRGSNNQWSSGINGRYPIIRSLPPQVVVYPAMMQRIRTSLHDERPEPQHELAPIPADSDPEPEPEPEPEREPAPEPHKKFAKRRSVEHPRLLVPSKLPSPPENCATKEDLKSNLIKLTHDLPEMIEQLKKICEGNSKTLQKLQDFWLKP